MSMTREQAQTKKQFALHTPRAYEMYKNIL